MRLFQLLLILILSAVMSFPVSAQFTLSSQNLGTYVTLGLAFGDYDNDGDDDLYMTNGNPSNGTAWENYLYRNNGDGTFTQITNNGPLVTDVYLSGGCSWGDYDNDGYLDLIVANPVVSAGQSRLSLYRNVNGIFTSETSAPVTNSNNTGKIDPAWADANNDGWLDLAVSNASMFGTASAHSYFTNDGDGTFTSVSNNFTAGTSARGSLGWSDVDADGDMDIVTCSGGPNPPTVLWVNTGTNFTSVTLVTGGQETGKDSNGPSFGDYDNDGDMDLYIVNYGDDAQEANLLFRNDGPDGNNLPVMTLMNAASGVGPLVSDADYSLASAWGDVDNDGDLDLFVGNDGGAAGGYQSRLYINEGGVFTDGTTTVLQTNADFARSVAFADVDNDGDLDLVLGREGNNRLFINTTSGNNWLEINLTGTNANKSAIGARVKLTATIGGSQVEQVREVSAHTGTGSQNSMRVHFGLGDATQADEIEIHWPGSIIETANNVAANQIINYIEGFVSDIRVINQPVPADFSLDQNYPNPFNPSTTIRFSLPESGHVQMAVYNVVGKKIRTLVSEVRSAGVYETTFNAQDLSSGVYFYSIKAGEYSALRKMMVIK